MTVVTLVRSKAKTSLKLTASGHAGFGPKGKDIVCAGVTVLCRTALEVLEQTGGIDLETDVSRRGYIFFSAGIHKPDVLLCQRLDTVGDVLEKGFLVLQEQYPDNVRFELILED